MNEHRAESACAATADHQPVLKVRPGARAIWPWIRWLIVFAVVGFSGWQFVWHASMPPVWDWDYVVTLSFETWYGNWRGVVIASVVFLVFALGLVWPRGPAQWRNAGLYSAFLVSLFVEMFGAPLTIFLVAPLLDVPALDFGLSESHLWAYLLDQARVVPLNWGVYLVMTVSLALIAIGLSLVAVGWAQVFGHRDRLATTGIYRLMRHPQYLGLILVIVAFNIQWPTLLTLLMVPVLIVAYVRQARREDKALERQFGKVFIRYASRVPAFIPWPRGQTAPVGQSEIAQ